VLKTWSYAYRKEFEVEPPNLKLKEITSLKKLLLKNMQEMLKDDIPKVSHIKGLGTVGLSGILAYAHPSRFPSLRKFLFYCGYTQASHKHKIVHKSGKSNLHYNRRIPPIMFVIVEGLIKQKNSIYYPLYLKMKEDAKLRCPRKKKGVNHYVAINRTATFLLKEIYSIWCVKNVS